MPSSQSNISISTSTAIIGLIVAVLIGIFAFRKCEPANSPSYPQQQAIDSLTQVIRGLQQQQHKLDGLLVMQLNHIDALDKQIDSTNNVIKQNREYYDRKIKAIYNYTDSQLDSFFATRYK